MKNIIMFFLMLIGLILTGYGLDRWNLLYVVIGVCIFIFSIVYNSKSFKFDKINYYKFLFIKFIKNIIKKFKGLKVKYIIIIILGTIILFQHYVIWKVSNPFIYCKNIENIEKKFKCYKQYISYVNKRNFNYKINLNYLEDYASDNGSEIESIKDDLEELEYVNDRINNLENEIEKIRYILSR